MQTKGQSETNPGVAPNDEFAGFELWTKPVAGPGTVKVVETNYVRNAFGNGLAIERSWAPTRSSTAWSAAATSTPPSSRTRNSRSRASTT